MSRQCRSVASVTGITQTSNNNLFSGQSAKGNDLIWTHGWIGVSVTRFFPVGVPSWAVEVYAELGGANYQVAGVSGIGSTTSAVVPITDAAGTTQTRFFGIPRLRHVNVIGSSTTVGATFSAVVTAHLFTTT